MRSRFLFAATLVALSFGAATSSAATVGVASAPAPRRDSPEARLADYFARFEADQEPASPLAPEHLQPCIGGVAGTFPCEGVDLLEFLPVATIGGGSMNDVWGWTDPLDGKEYALAGRTNGTAFVDISNPANSVYLGTLPSHTGTSSWRDIKTYGNYAFIVSDSNGNHGMQVFDLTRLRNVVAPPVTFTEDAWYGDAGSVHNIAIDEATGFAYLVGTSSGTTTCSGGLHMVNIQNPLVPVFAGCYSAHGYTHDTQCVVYDGPDSEHAGQEICFSANGPSEKLGIVNVTDKSAPVELSATPYAGSDYPHQGWLTEDQRYFLLDDELDEQTFGHNTRTRVWDVSNLEAPQLLGYFSSPTAAIDHNQYVRGNYSFQANYRSGLRILRLDDPAQATLTQVGYFDTYAANDTANFSGAWSVYPYFASGVVIVTSIGEGLFVLQPTSLCSAPTAPTGLAALAAGDNQIDLDWTGSDTVGNEFAVERALGGCGGVFEPLAGGLADSSYSDLAASGAVTYGYRVRELDASGFCPSAYSDCDEASTTGLCTASPTFAGLATATSPQSASCAVNLDWTAASPNCSGPVAYNVYRGTDSGLVPDASNRIATGVTATAFTDPGAPSLSPVTYVVRAVDLANGVEDANLVHVTATATGPVSDGTFATGAEIGDAALDTGSAPFASPEHAGWHITSERAHAPSLRSFWSTASNNLCVTLEGSLELTAGESPALSFWTGWDVEPGWDGGVVEISTNGGANWTRLAPAGGYPGTITNGGTVCGIDQGSGAFTGYGQLGFVAKSVDLAAFAGNAVRLRFLYRTDTSQLGLGWYVDDIAVTHAQVPGACVENGLLLEDFEAGGFGDWSYVSP